MSCGCGGGCSGGCSGGCRSDGRAKARDIKRRHSHAGTLYDVRRSARRSASTEATFLLRQLLDHLSEPVDVAQGSRKVATPGRPDGSATLVAGDPPKLSECGTERADGPSDADAKGILKPGATVPWAHSEESTPGVALLPGLVLPGQVGEDAGPAVADALKRTGDRPGEIMRAGRGNIARCGRGEHLSPGTTTRFSVHNPVGEDLFASERALPPSLTVSDTPASYGVSIVAARSDPGAGEVITKTYLLGYRTVFFLVEQSWLEEYRADWEALYASGTTRIDSDDSYGKVSSINDTLDWLWREYRTASSGDWDVLHSLLLCYNLPKEPEGTELFWRTGWGPAHKVYLNALQLLFTYSHFLQPENEPCSGFESFVRSALQGELVTNNVGVRSCLLGFLYKNLDAEFGNYYLACRGSLSEAMEAENVHCMEESGFCDEGFKVNKSGEAKCSPPDWYGYKEKLSWVRAARCWSGESASDTQCQQPGVGDCDAAAFASTGCYKVTLHPVLLAFDGYVCDYIMYLARMAFDYALTAPALSIEFRLSYLTSARQLASYVLRIIAEHGRLILHEVGHILSGRGGHCSADCCMNVTAFGWLCQVRAMLGLPLNAFEPRSDDYDPEDSYQKIAAGLCSDGDMSTECDVGKNGVPGQQANFCATGCMTSDATSDVYYCLDGVVERPRDAITGDSAR